MIGYWSQSLDQQIYIIFTHMEKRLQVVQSNNLKPLLRHNSNQLFQASVKAKDCYIIPEFYKKLTFSLGTIWVNHTVIFELKQKFFIYSLSYVS